MENKENKLESRRSFLKKAAYAVPTVVALGQITNPVKSVAGSFIGGGNETSPTPGEDSKDAYNIFGK